MNRCNKKLGSLDGYSRKCGGLWMGSISQCDSCKRKDMKEENLRLKNQILKEQLRQLKENSVSLDGKVKE